MFYSWSFITIKENSCSVWSDFVRILKTRTRTQTGLPSILCCQHGVIAGFQPIKTPPPDRYSSLATLSTTQNPEEGGAERGETRTTTSTRGAPKQKAAKKRRLRGGETLRRGSKQQQQQQQQTAASVWRQRLAQVRFTVTKETRGGGEGDGKKGNATAGRRWMLGTLSSRSPVHGPRGGRRGEEELLWSASLPHRSQGSNRGEQRAHFPFGDVKGEHGGSVGHASDHTQKDR